ncbi:hypothetical protein F0562_029799 [Nyssa sinensis]|uniref:Uncharacterized protein n=1 Tax=Nyssa sinensis TaxID=561372 RepID=A0A5J5AWE3_9ASTE|nr:hypothetical protein F0562_029799 [Nyssa sinensis]
MKILSWMQRKFDGKQGIRKPSIPANHHIQEPCKQEFSDWPQGLLAIGTFGNNNLKEDTQRYCAQGSLSPSQDITPEEIGELQKQLTLLLNEPILVESSLEEESETHILPLDNLNYPPRFKNDKINSNAVSGGLNDKDGNLQLSTTVALNRGKDIRSDHSYNAIGKKSLSLLLKKMFLCPRGFTPAPSFKDPLPEPRVEKIMRAILHKKIYPQSPNSKAKKYLENRYKSKVDSEDEMLEKANDGSKWVKTDSECMNPQFDI